MRNRRRSRRGVIFKKVVQSAVVLSFQDAFLAGSSFVVLAFIAGLFLPGKSAVTAASVKATDERVNEEMVEEIVCIE